MLDPHQTIVNIRDCGARRRNRTVTSCYGPGILSPVRLPVSPSGRAGKLLKIVYQLTVRT